MDEKCGGEDASRGVFQVQGYCRVSRIIGNFVAVSQADIPLFLADVSLL
jgi:hypothetical protein